MGGVSLLLTIPTFFSLIINLLLNIYFTVMKSNVPFERRLAIVHNAAYETPKRRVWVPESEMGTAIGLP